MPDNAELHKEVVVRPGVTLWPRTDYQRFIDYATEAAISMAGSYPKVATTNVVLTTGTPLELPDDEEEDPYVHPLNLCTVNGEVFVTLDLNPIRVIEINSLI